MLNILILLFILKYLNEIKKVHLIENKLDYIFLGFSIITFLKTTFVALTHLYSLVEFFLRYKFFKSFSISIYKIIQNDPNFIIPKLLSVFSFIIIQFIVFSVGYLYLLYKERLRNISKRKKEYLKIFKQIFPFVFFAIIVTEFVYSPFIGYLSVNYIFLYLVLLFTSFYFSLKEFKKEIKNNPNEKPNYYIVFFSLLIVCLLILSTCTFLFILLNPTFNTVPEKSPTYTSLINSLYYLSLLAILISMYLISYLFVYNINLGISKFNKVRCIFYLILFVLYILSRLSNFSTDPSLFTIKVLEYELNFKSAISEYSTEALLTVVIFDSFFQSLLEFKKSK